MATGDRRFTRIPPESTGDRILLNHIFVIPYNNLTGSFLIGDTITTDTSNFTGQIADIIVSTISTGYLYVIQNQASEDIDLVVNENIQINLVTQAKVATGSYILYANTVNVTGYNNPLNGMFVDNRGQAYMRFSEGAMQFDSFGRNRTAKGTTIAEYIFNYDILTNLFSSTITGSATAAHNATQGALLLTNTTGATDEVIYASDLYHRYTPGQGLLMEMTVACGDSGKANLERAWGYFDDDNGCFFKQTENDFEVIIRTNTSGSPVETSVSQADFNGDVVDGSAGASNLSQFTLDTTKDNLYWIDIQWLGAGRVRFGIFANGERIVLHTFTHGNIAFSYMRTGSLPLRFQQTNTGGTGSTSELRVFCAAITTEGGDITTPLNLNFKSFNTLLIDNSENYLFSLRPKATISGIDNRKVSLIKKIRHNIVSDSDASLDDRVIIKMWLNPTLNTPSWTAVSTASALEYDDSATLGTHVVQIGEFYLKGTDVLDFADIQNYSSQHRLINKADLTQNVITFTGENPGISMIAVTDLSVEWNEISG